MKKLLCVLLVAVMVFSLAACAGQGEEQEKRPVMGVCIFAIEVEYFTNLAHWLEVAAANHGWDIRVSSGDASDPSSQVDIIENFVTMGVDAIFINPINMEAVDSALQAARDKGIFIFGHNYRYEDSEVPHVYLSGNPFEAGGRITNLANTIAGDVLGQDAEIVCAALTSLTNENNSNRSRGMIERANELWGDDCVVAEASPESVEAALSAAENIYTVHPDINVWLCYNDEMASGVYQFYNASNLDQSGVVVVGVDGNLNVLQAIADNTCIRGTLSQALNVRCEDFFDAADILINGGTVEAAQEAAGYDLYFEVDAGNVQDQLEAANWNER